MTKTIFEQIGQYGTELGIIGAVIVFAFGVYKYFAERKITLYWKEFEVFHRLIKELVEPVKSKVMMLDRQIAIVFELRHYTRYYPATLRILKGLIDFWKDKDIDKRLIDEIDMTIKYIETTYKKCRILSIFNMIIYFVKYTLCVGYKKDKFII